MPYVTGKPCIDRSDLQRAWALALALGLAACSSDLPQPVEQFNDARAAISQAQTVAARDGASELRVAQYKLARGQQELERGNNAQARMFAEQAEVDARYAQAVAQSAQMQRVAAEASQRVRAMQDELDRRAK
jgi:Domain of unknown function (DUF4398)